MTEVFFTAGRLYTDRRTGQPAGVHAEFMVHTVVVVPGTEERVAFGFRRWNDTRIPGDAGRWYPTHKDEHDFVRFTVKQD